MNVYDSHQTAEQLHDWLARHMPDRPHPPVKRPINWLRWISGLTFVSGIATAGFVAWPFLLPIIQNRNIWAAVSLIAILLFTSGHMFNHIRKVPYIAQDGRGGISYFAGGFQNQLGMETQIVAAMCKAPRDTDRIVYIVHILTNVSQTVSWRLLPSPSWSKSPASQTPRRRASASWYGALFSSSCTASSSAYSASRTAATRSLCHPSCEPATIDRGDEQRRSRKVKPVKPGRHDMCQRIQSQIAGTVFWTSCGSGFVCTNRHDTSKERESEPGVRLELRSQTCIF